MDNTCPISLCTAMLRHRKQHGSMAHKDTNTGSLILCEMVVDEGQGHSGSCATEAFQRLASWLRSASANPMLTNACMQGVRAAGARLLQWLIFKLPQVRLHGAAYQAERADMAAVAPVALHSALCFVS